MCVAYEGTKIRSQCKKQKENIGVTIPGKRTFVRISCDPFFSLLLISIQIGLAVRFVERGGVCVHW